jgi:hypothetical protein
MAWARCPTHGPIQDAEQAIQGGTERAYCKCGLKCTPYQPEGFRAPEDLEGVVAGDNLNEPPQVSDHGFTATHMTTQEA